MISHLLVGASALTILATVAADGQLGEEWVRVVSSYTRPAVVRHGIPASRTPTYVRWSVSLLL